MNYNHLYYFYHIANKGSIAKAAQFLNVTQPTLSQQLKQFEDYLGTRLFNRSGKQLVLNSEGEFAYEQAKHIFGLAERLESSFLNQTKRGDDVFSVGMTPSISKTFAVNLISPLLSQKNMMVKVREESYTELLNKVYSMEYDMMLYEKPRTEQKSIGIEQMELLKPRYVFVCGDRYRDKVKSFPESLNDLPYFGYSIETGLFWSIENFFRRHQIQPRFIGESDDLIVKRLATESNLCFSILPLISIQDQIKAKQLFVMGELDYADAGIWGAYLSGNPNLRGKKMAAYLKKSLQKI